MVEKSEIINEIRRIAKADGKAPGYKRFEKETGISERMWAGRYWARWGDALTEAGFEPNVAVTRMPDEMVLEPVAALIRSLGRFPTTREMQLQRQRDGVFPSGGVFRRLGSRRDIVAKLASLCEGRDEYADVLEILNPLLHDDSPTGGRVSRSTEVPYGWVYLLKEPHGRPPRYKIGRTNARDRRLSELNTGRGFALKEVHFIRTDDPEGIERYWHERFAGRRVIDRRGIGTEFFELGPEDIAAFKRRKTM